MKTNSYDPVAESYADFMQSESSENFRFQHDLVISNLLQICGSVDSKRVLDAGCGEGTISRHLQRDLPHFPMYSRFPFFQILEFVKVEIAD